MVPASSVGRLPALSGGWAAAIGAAVGLGSGTGGVQSGADSWLAAMSAWLWPAALASDCRRPSPRLK
eukprot:5706504-Alexandrium_andersonii.AAC.1